MNLHTARTQPDKTTKQSERRKQRNLRALPPFALQIRPGYSRSETIPVKAPTTKKRPPLTCYPLTTSQIPPPEAPTMEKRNPVDQLSMGQETRFDRAHTFILANPRLFATQGSVVATWRVRDGKRFGPYYRLAYRRGGRQRSIYLGPRPVADRLREFLAQLQRPHHRHRLYKRLQTQVRASLRQAKKQLAQQLASLGVTSKGYEFRGAARALSKYRCKLL